MTNETRMRLRAIPVLTGSAPSFDTAMVCEDPIALFQDWLDDAVQAGVAEPHAMVVSTLDTQRVPDARVLTLKDVDERGWAFATTKSSAQGQQLAVHPHAALTFWWQPLVRSVRIRGQAVQASRADSLADLRARSAAAQQDVSSDDWTVWRVIPSRIEFWQGSTDRRHHRLVFVPEGDAWRVEVTP